MRTILFSLIVIFLFSLVSADVLVTQNPDSLYNLGDVVTVKTKIITNSYSEGFYTIDLVCGGSTGEVYKEYVILESNEEKLVDSKIPLTKSLVGSDSSCFVEATFNSFIANSNTFEVSDDLILEIVDYSNLVKPLGNILVSGNVVRENGKVSNGFLEFTVNGEDSFNGIESFKDGFFSLEIPVPKNFPSGDYEVELYAYEKDVNGDITNNVLDGFNVEVLQVPTNLEVILNSDKLVPGNSLDYNIYLRDQSGKNIESTGNLRILRQGNVIYQSSFNTGSDLEFETLPDTLPGNLELIAESNSLSISKKFSIIENKDLSVEIVNTTLILTNVGNVVYNDTFNIMIGDNKFDFFVDLDLGEIKKYDLSAPNGDYPIKVLTANGEEFSGSVFLTGNAISAKEVSEKAFTLMRHPIVWIFIIFLFGVFGYIMYKGSNRRNFFAYIRNKIKGKEVKKTVEEKNQLTQKKNLADLSLSLQGDKQDAAFVVLRVKNHKSLPYGSSSSNESLQKIVNYSEDKKAFVYESNGDLMFIFAPSKTKTFRNEHSAFELAEYIKDSLEHHNKMFKDKIEFGLSVTQGTIVAKEEKGILKFMALGTFLPAGKKVATVSSGEILMPGVMKDKMATDIKYEKKVLSGVEVYELKELKNKSKHDKFLKGFVKRMEGKN